MDRNEKAGQVLASELCENAIFIGHDVTQEVDWYDIVKVTETRFGSINFLINNAGVAGNRATGVDLTKEDFQKVCDINMLGVFLGTKAVIPAMITVGRVSIVNKSSVAGMVAVPVANPAYFASKFVVRGMSKQIAVEYGAHNIRCNSVHPGYIKTPMMDGATDAHGDLTKMIPLARIAAPAEVSKLAIFLASDESSYITGMEHVIDGGLTACMPMSREAR